MSISDQSASNEPGIPIWVYIAGCGRSGSTLLDEMLGTHPRVFSTGEIGRFHGWLEPGDTCSCGLPLSDCLIWSRVAARFQQVVPESESREWRTTIGTMESWRAIPRMLTSRHAPSDTEAYERYIRSFAQAVGSTLGVDFVVDSSKTVTPSACRPFLISDIAGLDLRALHLIRDGRGVVWSKIKAEQRRHVFSGSAELPESLSVPLEMTLSRRRRWAVVTRSIASWTLGNTMAALLARRLPRGHSITVTYEELTARPHDTLDRIKGWLQLEDPSRAPANPVAHQGHLFAGNRRRFGGNTDIRPDDSWRSKLTKSERFVFWLLAWPWALKHKRLVDKALTEQ